MESTYFTLREYNGAVLESLRKQSCRMQATMWWKSDYKHAECYSKRNQDPWHPQATTTGAPLLQGDALVAYEIMKRAKNSEGNENGEIKFDIKVRRV